MPPGAAGLRERCTNRFQAHTGSKTISVPGQRRVEEVVAANNAAMEALRFLSNLPSRGPIQQQLGFQTLPATAIPPETLLGFETLPESPAMSARPVRKNSPPSPLVRRAALPPKFLPGFLLLRRAALFLLSRPAAAPAAHYDLSFHWEFSADFPTLRIATGSCIVAIAFAGARVFHPR